VQDERRLPAELDALGLGERVEPDPAEMAERFSAETTVPEWRERLVSSGCGSRNVDMVVSDTEHR
jgi:hypothetical protein